LDVDVTKIRIIDDVNTTIENLVKSEFTGGAPFDLSFAVPRKEFTPISQDKTTLNFYLYDIREALDLRSNEPIVERTPAGEIVERQPAKRIQLGYCVTAWSPAADDAGGSKTREEHKDLSKALAILLKHPTIPQEACAGGLIGQEPPLPTTTILPNGIDNPGQFWNALDGVLKPFLDYRVTISLEVHEPATGPMVTTKVSGYGMAHQMYVLGIRPLLEHDHALGTSLAKMQIKGGVKLSLSASVSAGGKKIVLNSLSSVKAKDSLLIVDGASSEFCRLGSMPDSGNEVPITKPLRFKHAAKTEVKLVVDSPGAFDARLSQVCRAASGEVYVGGADSGTLQTGDILRLKEPKAPEWFQIMSVSGPHRVAHASDTFIQFGGLVTNKAPSPAPIVGAKVTLIDTQAHVTAETSTDSEGRYLFRHFGIETGAYTVKIEAAGYKTGSTVIADLASAGLKDLVVRLDAG
jgi:hypothetical protein